MANRVLASVRKMYNWAIGQDLVEHNPCFKLPAPSKERRRDRVLTNEKLKMVWLALESDKSSTIADAFKMRLLTAQRGGEVLSMRWADIDLKTRGGLFPWRDRRTKCLTACGYRIRP